MDGTVTELVHEEIVFFLVITVDYSVLRESLLQNEVVFRQAFQDLLFFFQENELTGVI